MRKVSEVGETEMDVSLPPPPQAESIATTAEAAALRVQFTCPPR
jgi:hypothetical protein